MKFFLLKYSLIFLVSGIAVFQFYSVYIQQSSRWKGGGFGMYSEIHPLEKQIWVMLQDSAFQIPTHNNPQKRLAYETQKLCFAPNQRNLDKYALIVSKTYSLQKFRIQIWEPQLNPETNVLTRIKIRETKYENR